VQDVIASKKAKLLGTSTEEYGDPKRRKRQTEVDEDAEDLE
jgi:hypothetical protein